MGECFHWFDPEGALSALARVAAKSNALVAVWGYRYPYFVSKDIQNDVIKENEKYLD